MDNQDELSDFALSQEALHSSGHDYVVGSPHLRHEELRVRIDERISNQVRDIIANKGSCHVLEIGAGHGTFTDTVLNAGGNAAVTEMSRPSFDHLRRKFSGDDRVTVLFDADGTEAFTHGAKYDLILLISVIHHIPDYLSVIQNLIDRTLNDGGAIITFQDPLWYPTQTRTARTVATGSYFVWRITQGELKKGISTRLRRLRGTFDDTNPSDLVEYHVVRDGVDQKAIIALLEKRFTTVELDTYFSTQLPAMQTIGGHRFPDNTFGVRAVGLRPLP